MHLYIATKGIKNEVDQFITELQGKYLPFKFRKDEKEPMQDSVVQLAVRPIQLWEIGFPKEHYDLVATTLLGKDYQDAPAGNDGKKGTRHTWLVKWIWGLRKLLHLDAIKPFNTNNSMPCRREGIMVIGVGTKEDYTMPTGVEGL